MAILKPQNPLTVNEQALYPLTSADQVIMENGERLNSAIAKYRVPAYTEADYGKALTPTAAGLVWMQQGVSANLTDAEEVAF